MRVRRTFKGAAVQALFGALLFVVEATPGRAQCEPAIEFVSDRTQFPTRAAHAVAFSGSVLGLLKVQPTSGPVYFATYDLDFNQLTADQIVADRFVEESLELFWTGSAFGLFYESISTELVLVRIGANGIPISGPIVIPLRGGLRSREFDVTFDSRRGVYVVVHSVIQGADAGLYLTFINPNGTKAREEKLGDSSTFDSNPRVAVAGDGTIGALYRSARGSLQLSRFSVGNVQQTDTLITTTTGGASPFIAASDGEFAIIFRMMTSTGSSLRWQRIDTDGTVVLPETELLVGRGQDVAAVDFFWNPTLSEFALAYLSSPGGFAVDPGEYRLRRFRTEDDVIDDSLFAPDPLRNVFLGRNNFVFTGSGYVSPADRPISQGVTESYLLKYCPFQVVADADRRNATIGTPVAFSADVAGGSSAYSFLWTFGDGTEQAGQFVQHVFATPGVYTVTVTATDSEGSTTTSSVSVSVLRPRSRAVRK